MLTHRLTKRLGSLCFLFLLFEISRSAQVNRTIDDTKGDSVTGVMPTYVPSTGGVWAGADCTGCAIQPDPTQAFDGTWTAATYHPQLSLTSIELSFTGGFTSHNIYGDEMLHKLPPSQGPLFMCFSFSPTTLHLVLRRRRNATSRLTGKHLSVFCTSPAAAPALSLYTMRSLFQVPICRTQTTISIYRFRG